DAVRDEPPAARPPRARARERRGRAEPGARRLALARAPPPAAPSADRERGLSVRHAWLVSRYPALSHSFIRREVRELRRRGVAIHTFRIRRPPSAGLLNAEDREESAATFAIVPAPPLALAAALLRALCTRPRRFFRVLALAFEGGAAGARAKLWR